MAQESRSSRVQSVDLLRGLVMVVMALDHARDFFGTSGWDPGFAATNASTFVTRWITHFCAPVFVLLAGTGAALSLGRGKSKPELARFLLTRGVWLALLDLTLVSFAWLFRVGDPFVTDVMWAIGGSMIVLAALIFLLMTLGPAMLALAALDGAPTRLLNPFRVFGLVPLFYYIVHLYLIHLSAALAFRSRFGAAAFHVDPDSPPAGFGLSLATVYVIWAGAVLVMYPLCKWFAGVKQRRRSTWLSYV